MLKKKGNRKTNEQGFVLVIALIVLLVATVVGVFAIQNTSIDTKISGNERIATLLFNAADAGADAGVSYFKSNTIQLHPVVSSTTAPWGSFISDQLLMTDNKNHNIKTFYSFKIEYSHVDTKPAKGYGSSNYHRVYYVVTGRGKISSCAGCKKKVEMEVSRVFNIH